MRSTFDCRFYILLLFVIFIKCTFQATQTPTGLKLTHLQYQGQQQPQQQQQQRHLTLYKPADYFNENIILIQQTASAPTTEVEAAEPVESAAAVISQSSTIPPHIIIATTTATITTTLPLTTSNDRIKYRNESQHRNRNTLNIKEIIKEENYNDNNKTNKTIEFELKQQQSKLQQNFTSIDKTNNNLNTNNDETSCAKQTRNNTIKWTNLTYPIRVIATKLTPIAATNKVEGNDNEHFPSKSLNRMATTTAKITTIVLKKSKKSYSSISSASIATLPTSSPTSLSSTAYVSTMSASSNSPAIPLTLISSSSMFDILKLKPQNTKYKWWQHFNFSLNSTANKTEMKTETRTKTKSVNETQTETEESKYIESSRKIFKDFYKPSQMMPSMIEQKQQQNKQKQLKQPQQHKAHSLKQVSPAKKPEHRLSVHVAHKIHHKELKTIHREAFKKKQQWLNRDKNESFKHYLNNRNNNNNKNINENTKNNNNNDIFLKRGKRNKRDTKLPCNDQYKNKNQNENETHHQNQYQKQNQNQNQYQNRSNEIVLQQITHTLDNCTVSNISHNNYDDHSKNNNNNSNALTDNKSYKQYNYTTMIPPRMRNKKDEEKQKQKQKQKQQQKQNQYEKMESSSHYLNRSFFGMMQNKRSPHSHIHSHGHSAIKVPIEVLSKPQESVVIIGDDEEFNSAADRKHEFAAFSIIDYDKNDENLDSRQYDDQPKVMPLRPILQNPYDDEEMSVIYAEQHTEIRLMCEVDLDIATTMWYKNGQVVHAMDRTTRVTDYRFIKEANGALTITNVMLEDDGKWQCEAENIKQYTLNARPVKLVVLDRPKPPYLLIDSRRLDAGNIFVPIKENSELNLACVSEGGNPKPTLNWEILLSPGVDRHAQKVSVEDMELEEIKNDKDKNSYKINSGAKSEARLKAVYRAHHNARILCVMEHPTLKIRQNASLLLDVQYTPSFAISRTPGFGYPLREGIEVSLKCDVDSNPPSTPRWQKDDGDPPVPQTGDGFLNFTTIRREHSGWYKCTSRHLNFQYSSIGYYLSVRYDSVDVTSEPDDQDMSVAASSHNSNKGQLEVQLGGAVTLQCPQGSLGCWSHLDPVTARLRGLGHGLSVPTGQFSLKDIVYQDAGTYKCIGQSPVNKKKLEVLETVSVTVKGTPTVVARNATPVAYPGSPLHLAVEFCANPSAHAARWLHGDRVYTPGNQYGSTVLAYAVTDLPIPFCKEARLTYVSMHDRVPRTFYFIVSSPGGVAEATFKVNFTVRYRTVTNILDDDQEELSEPEEIHFPVFGRASHLTIGIALLSLSIQYELLINYFNYFFFFFVITVIQQHCHLHFHM